MSVWRMHVSLRLMPVQREQTRTSWKLLETTVTWFNSISLIHCSADHETEIINPLCLHHPILNGECTPDAVFATSTTQNKQFEEDIKRNCCTPRLWYIIKQITDSEIIIFVILQATVDQSTTR